MKTYNLTKKNIANYRVMGDATKKTTLHLDRISYDEDKKRFFVTYFNDTIGLVKGYLLPMLKFEALSGSVYLYELTPRINNATITLTNEGLARALRLEFDEEL